MSENNEETVGIMKLKLGKLSTHVIVVGDPKRVDDFSVHLEVTISKFVVKPFLNNIIRIAK